VTAENNRAIIVSGQLTLYYQMWGDSISPGFFANVRHSILPKHSKICNWSL